MDFSRSHLRFLSLHLLHNISAMYSFFRKIYHFWQHQVTTRTGVITPSTVTMDRLVAYGGVGYNVWYDFLFSFKL